MSDFGAYLFMVLGVLASFVLPALVAAVKRAFPGEAPTAASFGSTLRALTPYLLVVLLALVAAALLLAFYRSGHPTGAIQWYTALLLGFGWYATLEKVVKDVRS